MGVRRTTWAVVLVALAVAGGGAVSSLTGASQASEERAGAQWRVVGEETLERSRRLAVAPDLSASAGGRDDPIAHAQLPAVAGAAQAQVPYPPGMRDRFDWAATPADPRDMGSVTALRDVQLMLQYRARCLWARFWLRAHGAGSEGVTEAATTVLAQSARWPALRTDERAAALTRAARSRTPQMLRAYASSSCRFAQ